MTTSMENILGGSIARHEDLPQRDAETPEQNRYIVYDGKKSARKLLREITARIDPLIPTSGTVMLEPYTISTPDQTVLFVLHFQGDLPGWQQQIEGGANQLGMVSAKIQGPRLMLSDGRDFLFENCDAHFN